MAGVDPADLLFLDETNTPTTLTPRSARSPRGERAVGSVPRGRWHSITLVATLTPDGMGPSLVLDGPLDRDAFDVYVAQILVPKLRPGQTVVLDNLSVHRAARVRRLVEAAGCRLLFLPPYSPDLNPIEPAWSKLKQLLRGAGARTTEALHAALARLVDAITPRDAAGYFRHCGYAVQ